jgi:hypothetical protein
LLTQIGPGKSGRLIQYRKLFTEGNKEDDPEIHQSAGRLRLAAAEEKALSRGVADDRLEEPVVRG